jgi:hypothetical protein
MVLISMLPFSVLLASNTAKNSVSIIFIQKSTYFPEGRSLRYNDLTLFEKMESAMTEKGFLIE